MLLSEIILSLIKNLQGLAAVEPMLTLHIHKGIAAYLDYLKALEDGAEGAHKQAVIRNFRPFKHRSLLNNLGLILDDIEKNNGTQHKYIVEDDDNELIQAIEKIYASINAPVNLLHRVLKTSRVQYDHYTYVIKNPEILQEKEDADQRADYNTLLRHSSFLSLPEPTQSLLRLQFKQTRFLFRQCGLTFVHVAQMQVGYLKILLDSCVTIAELKDKGVPLDEILDLSEDKLALYLNNKVFLTAMLHLVSFDVLDELSKERIEELLRLDPIMLPKKLHELGIRPQLAIEHVSESDESSEEINAPQDASNNQSRVSPDVTFDFFGSDNFFGSVLLRQAASVVHYLETGTPPEEDEQIPKLEPKKRLKHEQAVAETAGLNRAQLLALMKLYAYGLRGKHLRAWYGKTPEDAFSHGHISALKFLIKTDSLSIDEICKKINGLNNLEALELVNNRIDELLDSHQSASIS